MIEETDYIVDQLEKELKTLPKQKNQCSQHLIELGYIPLLKVNALTKADFVKAKVAFFEEAKASGLYTKNELTRQIFEDEDEFLADLLEQATDIDEGFVFDTLPEKKEVSLQTRIIHYRLDIFGLWPFAIDTPFNVVNTIAALRKIGEYAQCDDLETVNYLADVELLTKRLVKIHPEEDFILTFRTKNNVDPELKRKLNRTRKFKKQLVDDFGERSDFFKYLKKEILKENSHKVDFNFLDKELLNPFKQFVLRLIQVHQWQDGLYDGLLDSDIGEVTINSFLSAIELYNLTHDKNIQSFRVLTHLVENYFLFNGLFFMQEYMIENDGSEPDEDAEDKIVGDVLNDAGNADDKTLNAFEANIELLKIELSVASKAQPEEKKGLLKRIYFGVKKFFKKLISVSKKIFGWIVHLTKKFWGILKKVFGHFFSKLAKGIKAFVDGIKYLFGRKGTVTQNESGLIASRIGLGGDSFSVVSGNSTLIIPEHTKQIKYNVASLDFALKIVSGVVKIVMKAFNMLSWPMLIFSIIKIFKTISESYKKLELVTS